MNGNKTPRARGPACAPHRGQSPPSGRVLVVDDEPVIRLVIAQALASSGYRVDTAEDGEIGWEALRRQNYDLLITDHDMPKVSGVELVKKLRAANATLPVIMVSGAMPTEELKRYPWLQLAATLPKPFTGDQLIGTVKKVLGGSRCCDRLTEPFVFRRDSTPSKFLRLW